VEWSPANERITSGTGPSVMRLDRPTSRLSKRTTWKPAEAICWQKRSSHAVIWAVRPMIRSSDGSSGDPKSSYSMSIPLARTLGMAPMLAPA
jgi:hypothetical protein